MFSIDDLVQGTKGQLKNKTSETFKSITTDSRKDVKGKVFVALKGDVHDGHKFVADVVKNGVGAVIVHEFKPEWQPLLNQTTWIVVGDTLKALQDLSHYWRKRWSRQKPGRKIIGVTGSNGKTSVKDFTHTLLNGAFEVLKNQGSFNNHWGLPLTLLELNENHQMAVVEMGMNHAGEIKALCQIAEPDIAVVNNVGRAHSENFKTPDGIAKAKEEIYYGLHEDGIGVFNLADPKTKKMHEEWSEELSTIYTFGTPEADVYFKLSKSGMGGLTLSGQIAGEEGEVTVPIWGDHNLMNLMAASALALAAELEPSLIWKQLPQCQTGWGRNQWVQLKSGSSLLFDAYNANPDSFAALFKNLGALETPSKVIGVFGEMLEQGAVREKEHYELGKLAARSPVTDCFFIGASSPEFQRGFEEQGNGKNLVTSNSYEDSLALKIKSMLDTKSLVVVKGSRGGALERVVLNLDPVNFSTK